MCFDHLPLFVILVRFRLLSVVAVGLTDHSRY